MQARTWVAAGILAGTILAGTMLAGTAATADAPRRVISLDGMWGVAEGTMNEQPSHFDHTVPVPGLVDMAEPAFADVGLKSERREAFWYRRTFRVDGPVPAVAVLKIHQAMYGKRVFLNGTLLGDHPPYFTPGYFDARAALQSGENEILVRLGAYRDAVPKPNPDGHDWEKGHYIPGIFDSVELILSDVPHIVRIQAVPDIKTQTVTVHAWIRDVGPPVAATVRFTVREAAGGRIVGEGQCVIAAEAPGPERTGQATIAVRDCRLWSPEDPFLYEIETRTAGDAMMTRFGMRTFRLDRLTGRAILNGRPYFMRGSNICLFRFLEDELRGDKPWREDWVRRLHERFRDVMRWNSLRYCIGFPPKMWYRIADEVGILIQDEFPIWNMDPDPGDFDADELVRQYTEWVQERWNHPSVVIWSACNETPAPETDNAIRKVRTLDFSGRPWNNGWAPAVDPNDAYEAHPYHTAGSGFKLSVFENRSGVPEQRINPNKHKNPIILNEYGWLWLNRDGNPATISQPFYHHALGPHATPDQYRYLHARLLAAKTEFWRCRRACAAVMHFVSLSASKPAQPKYRKGEWKSIDTQRYGWTCDDWTDIENLTWDPMFLTYVRDAFAPVGLMLDAWAEEYPGGQAREFPVVVINDLYEPWEGIVRFRLLREGAPLEEKTQPCTVPALGDKTLAFTVDIPSETGSYQIEAALVRPGAESVRSLRDFVVRP